METKAEDTDVQETQQIPDEESDFDEEAFWEAECPVLVRKNGHMKKNPEEKMKPVLP